MNICIAVTALALDDNYRSFRVGEWYRLPFQFSEVSLTPSDKKQCSIAHLAGSRYSVVAKVDQIVEHTREDERGQLIILALGQLNLYFFGDYWDMYDQEFKTFKPGDFVEGEVELFLDCGLMRPFDYGLYDKIQEPSRNGFYLVKISAIIATSNGASIELEMVDGATARKYEEVFIQCDSGKPDGNFIRDDLSLKTLNFYLDRHVDEPKA